MSIKTKADVAIIGGGAFGTTLASLLREAGRRVVLWAYEEEVAREVRAFQRNSRYLPGFTLPSGIEATNSLEEAAKAATLLILAVPSKYFRGVARSLAPFITPSHCLVHTAKGIEIETNRRMSEVLAEEIPGPLFGVMSGPNLAREIMAGHPAGAVIASHSHEVIERMLQVFAGTRMRLYGCRDVIGVEVAGAFKNVVALAAGAVDGMGLGNNTKALLMTRGLNEMIRYGVALGAEVTTFAGLAGVGDLWVTCQSDLSRNHQVGLRIARGESLEAVISSMASVAEGVTTARAIYDHSTKLGLDLHVVCAVYRVLYCGLSPGEAYRWLMSNPTGYELDLRSIFKRPLNTNP